MAVKVKSKNKKEDKDKILYLSTSKKEDYKTIKLVRNGKVVVCYKHLADKLIKDGKASESKSDFELTESTIKHSSDLETD